MLTAPPKPLAAGWPVPLRNHSAAFKVGYYTPDKLPPTDPIVTWLPRNTTLEYLVRLGQSAPLTSEQATGGEEEQKEEVKNSANCELAVTVYMSGLHANPGGEPLDVSVGAFLPTQTIKSPPANGSRVDWTGVTATFPALPPTKALANGLVTVRLFVPVDDVNYTIRALDIECGSAT